MGVRGGGGEVGIRTLVRELERVKSGGTIPPPPAPFFFFSFRLSYVSELSILFLKEPLLRREINWSTFFVILFCRVRVVP